MEPSEWERLQVLFEELLESTEPETRLRAIEDSSVRETLEGLWREHRTACESGFLDVPMVSVRSLAEPELSFVPGQVLAGRFEIAKALGAGGMGEVYLALDQRLNERVAVKTIRRRLAGDPAIRERFVAEVQNARRVTHNNVCRIFEIFDEGETPFLAMELLEGPTLASWLRTNPPNRARRKVAQDLAAGLKAAHGSGVIHRDFKPDNIIILSPSTPAPRAVITDFGLARPFAEADGHAALSLDGGTREYMAPELGAGAGPSAATDIYAFGMVLKQLLPESNLAKGCAARNPERRLRSFDRLIGEMGGESARRWWLLGWLAAPPAAGAAYNWFFRPRLAFATRQRVLPSGFSPPTDAIASTLRGLLITGLRQSPLVTVVAEDRARALGGGGPMDRERLLALGRLGQIPFVLEGSLRHTGQALELLIYVVECATGKEALRFSESGEGKQLVALADRANLELRRNFGESEQSLRATYKPLSEATSASPEAVAAYFAGEELYEKAEARDAITWFDRAIEIDSRFALAHLRRGLALFANDQEPEALDAFERAYQLRLRVSERERLWIESAYQHLCAQDLPSAVDTLRRLVRLYPEEPTFQRQLAVAWARLGKPQDGLEAARKAIELDPESTNNRNVLIYNLAQSGRTDEALDYYRACRAENKGGSLLETGAGLAYMLKGDYEAAAAAFGRMTEPMELEREGKQLGAGTLILRGRFAEAARELEAELAADSFAGPKNHLETARSWLGLLYWLMDTPGLSRLRIAETAGREALPIHLPFLGTAAGVAFELKDTDDLERIRTTSARIAARWPSAPSKGTLALCEAISFWLAGDGRAEESFAAARGLRPDPLSYYWHARWQAGQGDAAGALAALANVEAGLGTLFRTYCPALAALSWVEQARCLKKMSRFDESLRFYERVLKHWEPQARSFRAVAEVKQEYLALLEGAKHG